MVRCLPPPLLQGRDTDDGSYKMLFSAVGVAGVWAMMLGGETEGLQGHPVALCAEKKAAHILLVTGSNRCVRTMYITSPSFRSSGSDCCWSVVYLQWYGHARGHYCIAQGGANPGRCRRH